MSFQRNSTLRQAFIDSEIKAEKPWPKLAGPVLDSIDRKVGLIRERGWNLSASKKMVEQVNQQCELALKPSF